MKTIRNALLGTTLAVTVALAGGSAFAADLSMPKPVKVAPAPAAESGNYVSVFGGLAIGGSLSGQMSTSDTGLYDIDIALQHGYVIGAAVGTTRMAGQGSGE